MLVYRRSGHIPGAPVELEGFQPPDGSSVALCQSLHGSSLLAALCDPILWQAPTLDTITWHDVDSAWQVGDDGRPFDPSHHLRARPWISGGVPICDGQGRAWYAPVIVDHDGRRAFPVAYGGADFLPRPTPDQQKAQTIAAEIRAIRLAGKDWPDGGVVRQWAAWLLTLTHHLSVPTIAALGLLDDDLVGGVLLAASGLHPVLEPAESHG